MVFNIDVLGKKVEILQMEDEINKLTEIMKKNDINSVLEIGTYQGGTAYYWDKIIKYGKITSIDINQNNLIWVSTSNPFVSSNNNLITFIKGNCVDVVKDLDINKKYDMLFIDGDHENALRDYSLYKNFATKLIVFDDLNWKPVMKDYMEIINKNNYKHTEIYANGKLWEWNVLGVLYKN